MSEQSVTINIDEKTYKAKASSTMWFSKIRSMASFWDFLA